MQKPFKDLIDLFYIECITVGTSVTFAFTFQAQVMVLVFDISVKHETFKRC